MEESFGNQEQEKEIPETNGQTIQEVEGDTPEAADDNDVPEPETLQEPPADKYYPEQNLKNYVLIKKFMLYE